MNGLVVDGLRVWMRCCFISTNRVARVGRVNAHALPSQHSGKLKLIAPFASHRSLRAYYWDSMASSWSFAFWERSTSTAIACSRFWSTWHCNRLPNAGTNFLQCMCYHPLSMSACVVSCTVHVNTWSRCSLLFTYDNETLYFCNIV